MRRKKTAWEIRQQKSTEERKLVRSTLLRIERQVDRVLVGLLNNKSEALRGVHSSALDSLQSARTSLVIAARRF